MSFLDQDAISVVITTYERPDACERALESALAQADGPLEVLVCDHGSADETPERFREWERRSERVRYLRLATNTGTPASARNLGVSHARGDWIAFLDDDDEWLPGKLTAQRAAAAAGTAGVIATNALRSDGSDYFPQARRVWHPTWLDMLRANPIITSSVLVKRDPLMAAGGFPTDLRVKGLEDYVTWLEVARRGASFEVLGVPLVRYDDSSSGRLSLDRARIQLAVARLAWGYALSRPVSTPEVRCALRHSVGVAHVLSGEALGAARSVRMRRAAPPRSNRGTGPAG